jgi:glucuronoarabinoxylan endo-1,4-beta-xylanase
MKTNPLTRVESFPLCVSLMLLCSQAAAQTATVRGTVTASTTPVRNASVTFEDNNSPSNTYSALTDSAGRYRIQILLTSAGPAASLPATFKLEQNYPNPFSSSTIVSYKLTTQSDIQVTIFDILGRVVRRMSAGAQSPGTHSVLWDGSNNSGQRVASGIYFYTLQAGGESRTKRMVLSGGGNGVLTLTQDRLTPPAEAGYEANQRLMGGAFTVRIENTVNTSPFIVSTQIDNVAIQGDSTLDCPVTVLPMASAYTDSVQQRIRGFGAANILPWRPDLTTGQVQTAFGAGQGQLGFTILRLRVPYTDDVNEFGAQVPTAALAQSLGAIVFASPWTPPPALKSNNNIVAGTLNDSSYAAYAAHLKGFADYMAANGAPLYAISLQNEPDATVTYESCSWNATQFLNFTKNNGAAIGTRIIMPESQNFVHGLSDSTLNDPSAAAHVAIIGGHIYGGGLGPYPLAVSKGKEVWMTEHLVLDTTWAGVLGTGMEIHNCMNAGMNAYVWWYLVRYYGPIGDDGIVTKRGFVMSQFSRFVRPGYYRIACSAAPQRNVYLSSYKDPASSRVVLIVVNTAGSAIQQGFAVSNGSMASFAAYTTSQAKNCAQGIDIPVASGRFAVSLDPSSITTFISK